MLRLFNRKEYWKEKLRDEIAAEIREEVINNVIEEVRKEETLRLTQEHEEHSTITLIIDNDLNVKTVTKINPEVVETLLEKDYLPHNLANDKDAIQFAFVLIANEVTDQIIEEVNEVANG